MTAEQRLMFLARFSEEYDLAGAAGSAGIDVQQARQLLQQEDARRTVDEHVTARQCGETLAKIAREYERVAFGEDEDARPGDRLRALEQLRLIASSETKNGAAPTLSIQCVYV